MLHLGAISLGVTFLSRGYHFKIYITVSQDQACISGGGARAMFFEDIKIHRMVKRQNKFTILKLFLIFISDTTRWSRIRSRQTPALPRKETTATRKYTTSNLKYSTFLYKHSQTPPFFSGVPQHNAKISFETGNVPNSTGVSKTRGRPQYGLRRVKSVHCQPIENPRGKATFTATIIGCLARGDPFGEPIENIIGKHTINQQQFKFGLIVHG